MSDIKMSERFGAIPYFDIKEFMDDDRNFAIPSVNLCYQDINKAVNNYDQLTEENAQLKADNAELVGFIESLCPPYIYDEDGNIIHMGGKSTILMGTNYEGHIYQLIQKHKGEINGN